MQTQAGKFRSKKSSFTTMSNVVLLDKDLDMATKSLHALINYFLSIPNFTLFKNHVQHHTGLGDKAFNRMWRLLKEKGYLIQHKHKDAHGIFYYEYELLDQPLSPDAPLDPSTMPNATPDEPVSINKTIENNTLKNNTLKKQQQVIAVSKLDEEIRETYQKAFSKLPNAMVEERLLSYLYRFEKDAVLLAIEMAGTKAKNIDYVYGILRVWAYEGVYTLADVVQYEEHYR